MALGNAVPLMDSATEFFSHRGGAILSVPVVAYWMNNILIKYFKP